MKIELFLILGFISLMILAMVSGVFFNHQQKPISIINNRIWCYVRTVPSFDRADLKPGQIVVYTRGGIDVMEKCQ